MFFLPLILFFQDNGSQEPDERDRLLPKNGSKVKIDACIWVMYCPEKKELCLRKERGGGGGRDLPEIE